MPTIKDVARASGVSPATVSYVLNNGPKQVRPHTRERILRTMREMNYHPSAVARGLSRKRMNAIGVVFPNEFPSLVANPYVGPLLEGLLEVATRRRQNVTLFTGQLWSDTEHSLPVYADGRCDGMVLISPPEGSDIVPGLLMRGVPFLLVGADYDDPAVSSVDIDDFDAAYELVSYILKQGHRRIAYLGGERTIQSSRLRHEGYRKALENAGVAYRPEYVPEGRYYKESGAARAISLIDLGPQERPTALFCGNDEIALSAMQALRDRGITVPGDVSVAGFDDIAAAATSTPPLTTVHQPIRLLGERAADLLISMIEDRPSVGQKELLDTKLVIRESVAPPAKA